MFDRPSSGHLQNRAEYNAASYMARKPISRANF